MKLPLFPLETVLFPGTTLPLHVFEPRYRELVARCLEHDEPFGVCLILEGEEVGGPAIPRRVGTEAGIIACQRYRDGRYDIVVEGRRRFEIVETDRSRRYLQADVRFLPEMEGGAEPELADAVAQLFHGWIEGAELQGQAIADETWKEVAPGILAYRIAAVLPLEDGTKQELLETPDPDVRLRKVANLLTAISRIDTKAGAT